jgi:hypothetical protein
VERTFEVDRGLLVLAHHVLRVQTFDCRVRVDRNQYLKRDGDGDDCGDGDSDGVSMGASLFRERSACARTFAVVLV